MLNNEKEIHSEKSSRNHYEDNMVLALQDYYNQKKYLLRPWVMFNTLGKIITSFTMVGNFSNPLFAPTAEPHS